jgi:hypothetical protein
MKMSSDQNTLPMEKLTNIGNFWKSSKEQSQQGIN